jgi:mannose-6-phosphate isomerase-like protein (cupin superfamily)
MAVITAPDRPTHDLGGTHFTSLATPSRGSSETAVWRVVVEPGVVPTPHRLTREEVFVVLAGRADVTLAGVGSVACVGDAIVVPPDTDFALSNGGPDELELVCCLPVGGQAVTADATFTPPWAQ